MRGSASEDTRADGFEDRGFSHYEFAMGQGRVELRAEFWREAAAALGDVVGEMARKDHASRPGHRDLLDASAPRLGATVLILVRLGPDPIGAPFESQLHNLRVVSHPCNFTNVVTGGSQVEGSSEKAWLSVVVPEELKRWVRVEAAQRDMSASAYVRELVERERRLLAGQQRGFGAQQYATH